MDFIMKKTRSVGVVGLGRIGSGLVLNLLKAGLTVFACDSDTEKLAVLAARGARPATSPGAMAAETDRIVLSLPNASVVESVVFGEVGIVQARPAGCLVIDTTTTAPEDSRSLAKRLADVGIDFMEAPVTGGEGGAREGTLSLMVGGSPECYAACSDIFEAVSQKAVLVGDVGAGASAKMVNQLLMCAQIASAAEAMLYCEKQAVDFDKVVEAINPSLQSNLWLQNMIRRYKEYESSDEPHPTADQDHYTPLFVKDLNCMLKLGAVQPIASAARDMVQTAVDEKTAGPFIVSVKTGLDAMNKDR